MRALDQVIEWRGKPAAIRSDHRPEYVDQTLAGWVQGNGVRLDHIQPGHSKTRMLNASIVLFATTGSATTCSSQSLRYRIMQPVGSGSTITNARTWPWAASPQSSGWPWPRSSTSDSPQKWGITVPVAKFRLFLLNLCQSFCNTILGN